jgi:hypothetical protein
MENLEDHLENQVLNHLILGKTYMNFRPGHYELPKIKGTPSWNIRTKLKDLNQP